MAERPEDLNLPSTVVQRLIKEALPDGVNLSKEAKQTICRASSVFVLYLTACAVTHANKGKRKTLAVNDIFSAISDMEFDSFIQPLKDALKNRKEHEAQQAASKSAAKSAAKAQTADKEEEEGEEIVEDGDDDVEEIDANNVNGAGIDNNEDEEEAEENENENDEEAKNKKRKLNAKNDNHEDANSSSSE